MNKINIAAMVESGGKVTYTAILFDPDKYSLMRPETYVQLVTSKDLRPVLHKGRELSEFLGIKYTCNLDWLVERNLVTQSVIDEAIADVASILGED